MALLIILSRWLHVVSACVALGGVFFARFVLPAGLSVLEPEQRRAAHMKTRSVFKRVIHTAILLFLITGIYNSALAWDKYALQPAILHALWGVHVLAALLAIALALYALAGTVPRKNAPLLLLINLVLLLAAVAAASGLKWARERAVAQQAAHPAGALR